MVQENTVATIGRNAAAAPKSASRRGRGRPVGDRESKRDDLLQAAISVIASEGFANASLRKVAQRAGQTTGAVTYYFQNKEAMVAAVAESAFDLFDQYLSSAGDDIRMGFERWLTWADAEDPAGWYACFQLLAHARHEPVLAEVFQRRYSEYRQNLASIVEAAQARGEVRTDIDAELLADQLSAIADGWMMMQPVEPERFRPERIKALLDSLMIMIAPSGTPPSRANGRTSR